MNQWRKKIDRLNTRLVSMLNKRAFCAMEIGRIKKRLRLPVFDAKREEQVLKKVTVDNGGPLDNASLKRIFKIIMQESRRLEDEI